MALTLDGTNGIVSSGSITTQSANGVIFSDSSALTAASSPYVLKNRIINGDMRIDQRNAGASVTPADTQYSLDRWKSAVSAASKFSIQQSTLAPTGFSYSLGITSLSAFSIVSTSYFGIAQSIEGYNVADLDFGTANAKTITISFWARSSLTGTFGGCIRNENADRAYPFTYTISAANTWEQKTVTIPGDTTGTWNKTNGTGLQVCFSVGTGSSYSAAAGAWTSTAFIFSATGATSLVGTNGATFYITGVQLEIGTSATPFERRMYGQELINCQRYYEKSYDLATVPGTGSTPNGYTQTFANNGVTTAGYIGCSERFKVEKRAAPTMTSYDWSGNAGKCTRGTLAVGNDANQTWAFESSTTSSWIGYSSSGGNRATVFLYWTASIEL